MTIEMTDLAMKTSNDWRPLIILWSYFDSNAPVTQYNVPAINSKAAPM